MTGQTISLKRNKESYLRAAGIHLNESVQLPVFKVKDPISALTHFIGFLLSVVGMPILLINAARHGAGITAQVSYAVFMFSMILLYGASSAYHAFHISESADKVLKKIDHMMIFVLIAGSYTPVCVNVLRGGVGMKLLLLIWGIALAGILFKAFWVTCPKWVSSVIYIGMGWVALLAIGNIYQVLQGGGFAWLLAGGIIYTIGGVIYALKLPILSKYFKGFGAHELFHLFVMGGSFCHYMMMLLYVTKL